MIHIFEKFAPRWQRTVKKYALSVWQEEDTDETRLDYDVQAASFARMYRHALEEYYRRKGMTVYRGTIDGKVKEWLASQDALRDSIAVTIQTRKQDITEKEISRLKSDDSYTAQKMLNKIYGAKENEQVYKVFSFADHFKDRAEQIGDENAYNLGTDINEAIIQQHDDKYIWMSQHDKRVRDTHRQLNGKCFLFSDPPTTIAKNGKVHTGNPGTDWGCRCYAALPEKGKSIKPLRDYTVHEK